MSTRIPGFTISYRARGAIAIRDLDCSLHLFVSFPSIYQPYPRPQRVDPVGNTNDYPVYSVASNPLCTLFNQRELWKLDGGLSGKGREGGNPVRGFQFQASLNTSVSLCCTGSMKFLDPWSSFARIHQRSLDRRRERKRKRKRRRSVTVNKRFPACVPGTRPGSLTG